MRRCTLVGEIWEMSSSAIFFRMVVFPALSKLDCERERGRERESVHTWRSIILPENSG
jgi:hypothetical protein